MTKYHKIFWREHPPRCRRRLICRLANNFVMSTVPSLERWGLQFFEELADHYRKSLKTSLVKNGEAVATTRFQLVQMELPEISTYAAHARMVKAELEEAVSVVTKQLVGILSGDCNALVYFPEDSFRQPGLFFPNSCIQFVFIRSELCLQPISRSPADTTCDMFPTSGIAYAT